MTHFRRFGLLSLVGVGAAAVGLMSCNGGIGATSTDAGPSSTGPTSPPGAQVEAGGADAGVDATVPFESVPARVYVAKVKTLLTGLPPTQDEVDAIAKNPSAMAQYVETWVHYAAPSALLSADASVPPPVPTPPGNASLFSFFQSNFQQTQINAYSLGPQLGSGADNDYTVTAPGNWGPTLVQQFQQSFARTAMQDVMVSGKPFNSLFTTQTYMVTNAMLVSMLFFDRTSLMSDSIYDDDFLPELSKMVITDQGGPIPIADTLNPNSPNYLHWYTGGAALPCGPSTINVAPGPSLTASLYALFLGFWNQQGYTKDFLLTPITPAPVGASCTPTTAPLLLQESDFTDWRMVSFRQLNTGETPVRMWDLTTIRAANETVALPLRTARVGFFTTPAFLANWPSNSSNLSRATTNQSLVVGLGQSFDGTNVISQSGLITNDVQAQTDQEHANNPACLSCHAELDPLRQYFTQEYNTNYGFQTNTAAQQVYGAFNFDGVQNSGATLYTYGTTLSTHSALGPGWVQKLCYWANSSPCDPDDPLFVAFANSFAKNDYNFPVLLRDFLSSPLVTGVSPTQTASENGEVISISRLDHFCQALNNRLAITAGNACSFNYQTGEIALSIATDTYTRGATEPFQPADPSLFFRAAVENLCIQLASSVVDPSGGLPLTQKPYSSADPQAAITDFAQNIMAITPSDVRSSGVRDILSSHYATAISEGHAPTDALRSTFVLACTSPSSVSIGL